jgi:hypothetical protein
VMFVGAVDGCDQRAGIKQQRSCEDVGGFGHGRVRVYR